jgi:hypothetical protein
MVDNIGDVLFPQEVSGGRVFVVNILKKKIERNQKNREKSKISPSFTEN